MDVPEPTTQLFDTLESYVEEFRNHQEAVKAHLRGALPDEPSSLPAFIPPGSYWTSAEKDLFFHGVMLYSRLQPELIARHIATKTTFDVCVFLDVLNRAAKYGEEESETEEEHRETGSSEPAMEMSESWIQREEAIAASLLELDTCPSGLVWSGNDKRCRCPSTSRLYDGETEGKDAENKSSFLLSHLDSSCLLALENIIQAAEHEDNTTREGLTPTLEENQVLDPTQTTQG